MEKGEKFFLMFHVILGNYLFVSINMILFQEIAIWQAEVLLYIYIALYLVYIAMWFTIKEMKFMFTKEQRKAIFIPIVLSITAMGFNLAALTPLEIVIVIHIVTAGFGVYYIREFEQIAKWEFEQIAKLHRILSGLAKKLTNFIAKMQSRL